VTWRATRAKPYVPGLKAEPFLDMIEGMRSDLEPSNVRFQAEPRHTRSASVLPRAVLPVQPRDATAKFSQMYTSNRAESLTLVPFSIQSGIVLSM